MSDLLYVGNLPKSATERDLWDKFSRSGTVNSAVIVTDPLSRRGRRFGLVEMSNLAEAKAAIGQLNMTQFDDTIISVNFSRSHQQQQMAKE